VSLPYLPAEQVKAEELSNTDEIDSYMYQSVGTSLLPLLAKSMRLPLYRHVIKGKPVEVGGTYGSRNRSESSRAGQEGVKGDETEDLEELLLQVKVSQER
jgi:diphthine-ammonia ligase